MYLASVQMIFALSGSPPYRGLRVLVIYEVKCYVHSSKYAHSRTQSDSVPMSRQWLYSRSSCVRKHKEFPSHIQYQAGDLRVEGWATENAWGWQLEIFDRYGTHFLADDRKLIVLQFFKGLLSRKIVNYSWGINHARSQKPDRRVIFQWTTTMETPYHS